MAAFLDRDDLRRLAAPAHVLADLAVRPPLRPVASWHVGPDGRLTCVWVLR